MNDARRLMRIVSRKKPAKEGVQQLRVVGKRQGRLGRRADAPGCELPDAFQEQAGKQPQEKAQENRRARREENCG